MIENIEIGSKNNLTINGHIHTSQSDDLIIAIHGFKSFCDWGFWPYVSDCLSQNQLEVLRFNFTHNGVSKDDLLNFSRLDLFGKNTYSLEIDEIKRVVQWVREHKDYKKIHLLGHSRGGGMAVLAASECEVDSVITLNAIDSVKRFDQESLESLKKDGVVYIHNARTKQDMPIYRDIMMDMEENESRLDILKRAEHINKPCLHIHSSVDTTVDKGCSINLKKATAGEYYEIEGSDHVFGCKHPFDKTTNELETVLKKIIKFINNQ